MSKEYKIVRPASLWEQGCQQDTIRNEFVVPTLIDIVKTTSPSSIADLGCGTGYISRKVAESLSDFDVEWLLLDYSEDMLQFAQDSCAMLSKFEIRKIDLREALSLKKIKQCDLVFVAYTFLDIGVTQEVAANVASFIKPSGHLVIFVPDVLEDVIQAVKDDPKALEMYLEGHYSIQKLDKFTCANVLFEANRIEMLIEKFIKSGLVLSGLDIYRSPAAKKHYCAKFMRLSAPVSQHD